MESNEREDSKDYPKWRAFLTRGLEGEVTPESAQDPLGKLAGALAFVRQGVRAGASANLSRPESAQEPSLEIREVDGEQSLEFTLEDAQLGDITCRLHKRNGGIAAVFLAKDINTERLLKAEVGRLRVQLEGKGLKVDGILVQREDL